MRIRHFVLPALSVAGMAMAFVTVRDLGRKPADPPLAVLPARSPFAKTLAGSGLVEPSSRFVSVGPERSGVAVEVAVVPGAVVARGDVLFKLDARAASAALAARSAEAAARAAVVAVRGAEVAQREAGVGEARAGLARLRAAPRPEEVPPLEARVAELDEQLKDDADRLARQEMLVQGGAGIERDLTSARLQVEARRAVRAKAAADLALVRAGAWAADVDVAERTVGAAEATAAAARAGVRAAEAEHAAAEAIVHAAQVELELLTVRAPLDATVLQVEVRPGEFVSAGASSGAPPVILGDVDPLHVRVDLDENDAGLFRPGSPGKAFVRGRGGAEKPIGLEFVRVEPYVVPKRALTGSVQERVDVRVLQLVYRVSSPPAGLTLYCGQQLDVFIDDANGS